MAVDTGLKAQKLQRPTLYLSDPFATQTDRSSDLFQRLCLLTIETKSPLNDRALSLVEAIKRGA